MAFLDKVEALAKTVGDKTSEAVEYTKLNTKILTEKNNIKDEYKKLGEIVYKGYLKGEACEKEVVPVCQMIDRHNEIIKDMEQKLAILKASQSDTSKDSNAGNSPVKTASDESKPIIVSEISNITENEIEMVFTTADSAAAADWEELTMD